MSEQDIKTADWSDEVAPFWDAVIRSALTGKGLAGLLRAGWTTLKVCVLCCHVAMQMSRWKPVYGLHTAGSCPCSQGCAFAEMPHDAF